jgi:phospholipid transport system substrate-binding protein
MVMEMSVKRQVVLLLATVLSVLGLVLGGGGVAHAGDATDVVKAKQTALFELIKQGGPNQQKIQGLFDEMLDYQALAEASLGDEWAARSDAEKAQFSDVLKQLVRKAYEKNLKKTAKFQIDYTGEEAGAGGTLVKTKATDASNAREEPIEISFKMAQAGGAWKVQDIITEGASLVRNYRVQFTKIVKKDGFPALIKKMQDKLAKGDV